MHKIRREKRTTISEVIVRGKRNIKEIEEELVLFKLEFYISQF